MLALTVIQFHQRLQTFRFIDGFHSQWSVKRLRWRKDWKKFIKICCKVCFTQDTIVFVLQVHTIGIICFETVFCGVSLTFSDEQQFLFCVYGASDSEVTVVYRHWQLCQWMYVIELMDTHFSLQHDQSTVWREFGYLGQPLR